MPNALIFGITGQDGAYLARLLLDKNYRVFGAHRIGDCDTTNLRALGAQSGVQLLPFDFAEGSALDILEIASPDEVYNLAAQSSVAESFKVPVETGQVNGLFVARLLHALRESRPTARFFQASSSEIFGAQSGVLSEESPLRPCNPYGCAKAYAHSMTTVYREAFGLHAGNGILFNHESPLRAPHFVTRKITLAVAKIKHGQQRELRLGNLEVERDWGFAGDYVQAMWHMLQQPQAGDYIIATGQLRRLRDWVDCAFACAGLDSRDFVSVDAAFLRPTDVVAIAADVSKTASQLDWRAQTEFENLIAMMVEADLRRVANGEV